VSSLTPDPKKRSYLLPPGCKDLGDVLKSAQAKVSAGISAKAKAKSIHVKVNGKISAPEVRVIDEEGGQIGIMRLRDALELAKSKGLDLAEIAPTAKPPVCRLIDHGKFRYEKEKRKKKKKQAMKTFIGLLRGINVGGNNKISMAELRALGEKMGWENVQTYIQSGNIVFSASGKAAALEMELERAIVKRFGLSIPVVARAAADWPAYIKSNPFLGACKKDPHLVMLCLAKTSPKSDAAKALRQRAAAGERIEQIGDALWIHFPNGVARSKLSPALLDRVTGSSVTARNWLTVLKLQEMASQAPGKAK